MKKIAKNALKYFLLFTFFCGCQTNSSTDKNTSKQTINIGAILSLSGDGAEYGKDEQRAINLFIENIASKSNKYDYRVDYQDSKSTTKDAVNALNSLISTNKPDVVLSVLSSVCMTIKSTTEKNEIPLFCVSANPQLTDNTHFLFRSLPTSDYQAQVLANKYIDEMKDSAFSILYINDDFGTGCLNSFKTVLSEKNRSLISAVALDPSKTDYQAEVTKVMKNKPQVIYIASYGSSIAYVLKNLTELGFKGTVLSTLEVSYPNVLSLAKNTAENVYYVDTYYDDTSQNTSNGFVKAFKAKYNLEPTLDAVLAYDEMNVVFKTIEEHGKSPENFEKIKGLDTLYASANGSFKISAQGDFLYTLALKKISNGSPIIISK